MDFKPTKRIERANSNRKPCNIDFQFAAMFSKEWV